MVYPESLEQFLDAIESLAVGYEYHSRLEGQSGEEKSHGSLECFEDTFAKQFTIGIKIFGFVLLNIIQFENIYLGRGHRKYDLSVTEMYRHVKYM